jgi:hypothetical protein
VAGESYLITVQGDVVIHPWELHLVQFLDSCFFFFSFTFFFLSLDFSTINIVLQLQRIRL